MDYMKKYNVMLGSDPELLLNKSVYGTSKTFPIIGLLGHGKENPLHIDDSGFRTLQEDNVALEFTTHPTSTKANWLTEQSMMYEKAKTLALGFGLTIETAHAARSFEKSMLKSEAAKTFGCDPTWNCYKNKENPPPNPDTTIRSVGGHVHISYDGHTPEKNMELIKLLDLVYITTTNVNFGRVIGGGETSRRNLYGKAGEARLKTYGVEWRVPSNAWIHDAEGRSTIWDIVETAFNLFAEGRRLDPKHNATIIQNVNRTSRINISASDFLIPLPAVVKKVAAKKPVATKSVVKKESKTTKPVSRKLTLESIPF